jgi:hypothetical protein
VAAIWQQRLATCQNCGRRSLMGSLADMGLGRLINSDFQNGYLQVTPKITSLLTTNVKY